MEKTREFCGFVAIHDSFFRILVSGILGATKASNPRKSYFSLFHESFLPRKYSAIRYV